MKLRLLDFGTLKADLGWFIEAAGVSTHGNATPEALRRDFQMLGALIEHPKEGVVLYDVGPAPNWAELWPGPVKEVFGITRYSDGNRLDNLLRSAGYGVKDVKAIVLSHMHLDHAGGLEFFRGLDVPIYVHEHEFTGVGAAYLTIDGGAEDDRLVSASTDRAAMVHLHTV